MNKHLTYDEYFDTYYKPTLIYKNYFEQVKEIDELQQELQRKDNIINGIKCYVEIGISANFNMNNGDYQEGLYSAFCKVLDKINELEGKNEKQN